MKAIIIDDELNARILLKEVLGRYCPNVIVIGEAEGVQQGFELLKKGQPDILFLDIKMNDGTGFDLLDLLETIDFKLVFTTAYDEYAIKAFKFGAVDYLLKPITPVELKEAVNRIEKQQKITKEQLRILNRSELNSEKIALPTSKGIHMVSLSEITYCKGDGSYLSFYTNEGRIVVSKNLAYYEELLPSSTFFRVHQSYLVNLNHIKTVVKSDGGFLVMSGGQEIPLSQRRKENLFLRLNL